jgi:hypothetical protein
LDHRHVGSDRRSADTNSSLRSINRRKAALGDCRCVVVLQNGQHEPADRQSGRISSAVKNRRARMSRCRDAILCIKPAAHEALLPAPCRVGVRGCEIGIDGEGLVQQDQSLCAFHRRVGLTGPRNGDGG